MTSILYCGDTELTGAACYLAGLMVHWGWQFDYVPSAVRMTKSSLEIPRSLLILSDYPSSQFDEECQDLALKQIERGCGLLMIGGWESFHGFGGNWEKSKLAAALPVNIDSSDDRVNFDQSAWLLPNVDHPATSNLPWKTNPPAIGGMNRVRPKPDSTVVLTAHAFSVSSDTSTSKLASPAPNLSFHHRESLPALVVGNHGAGRTATFLSDVAPHWVGGLVDWGLPRVAVNASYIWDAGLEASLTAESSDRPDFQKTTRLQIEVGHHYAQFWKQLIEWTAGISTHL